MLQHRATILSDASFCPETQSAAWACWIVCNWPNGRFERFQRSGLFKQPANNSTTAELWASYNGLWYAYRMFEDRPCALLVQTDCKGNINKKHPNTHWPNAIVEWRHVKAHVGTKDRRSYCNDWCDREAKRLMRNARQTRSG